MPVTSAAGTVLVVAKTHLDLGFTDLAARVLERYLDELVPAALVTARHLREVDATGTGPRLRWTVGSWLLTEALERGDAARRAELEAAIEAGDLAWHAWPFTTHTGLLDPSLAEWATTLSARLDRRFGVTTVAAKMTDVPGHPRALVPILAGAGVRLLHLGVNPASTPPDVPPVFRWRDEGSGTEIVVVYQRGGYGGAQVLPGTDDVLVVDHTGDNLGPPTVDDVTATWSRLVAEHPGAAVRPARLDDAWHALDDAGVVGDLPVVTAELGDTWIHGAASDPTKLARYRALCRIRSTGLADGTWSVDDPAVERASRALLCVAEHTWGLDEKSHLGDDTTWSPADLARARRDDPRFAAMEASWAEQRAYVDEAAEALGQAVTVAAPPPGGDDPGAGLAAVHAGSPIAGRHATVVVDLTTGALMGLTTAAGRPLAGRSHPIGRLEFQTFDAPDDERWYDDYVVAGPDDEWWARADQTKPGIDAGGALSWTWQPTLSLLRTGRCADRPGVRVVADVAGPPEAVERFGCPEGFTLTYDLPDDEPVLLLTLDWHGKRACRLPEATWLTMHPKVADPDGWRLDVLGRPLDPADVVPDGGRALHAIGRGVAYVGTEGRDGPLVIDSLDAGVVAPGRPMLRRHRRDLEPDLVGAGLSWLLHTNTWGTNFPMWIDDECRFRFALRWDER